MCIDSGGWTTVEKAPYFVILQLLQPELNLTFALQYLLCCVCLPISFFLPALNMTTDCR